MKEGQLIMNCLIVDDEPLAHDIIIEYVQEVSYLEIQAQAYRPSQALEILKSEKIDLLFLDIQMPKLTGLEMLRLVEHPPITIITSAYSEYGVESYELNVCDYLLKPYRLQRFLQATEKAYEIYKEQNSGSADLKNYIVLKSDKKVIRQNKEDIIFIESYGNYIKVHTAEKMYLSPNTLTRLKEELNLEIFCQVHKSFLLNLNHVEYIEGNTAIMSNGSSVVISKSYRSDVLKKFKA